MSFQVKDWADHFQLAQFHSRSSDGAEGLCPGIVCLMDQCGQGIAGWLVKVEQRQILSYHAEKMFGALGMKYYFKIKNLADQ